MHPDTELEQFYTRSHLPGVPSVELPERVIDQLYQAAGVSTYHPDGDQQEKLYAFARNVIAETLARLPAAPAIQAAGDAVQSAELIGETRENGVQWFNQNPHAYPIGTKFYAAPVAPAAGVPTMRDAYVGAREDLAIWKRRALEAEDLNRKFIASANGPLHMGEPAAAQPDECAAEVKDKWKIVDGDCREGPNGLITYHVDAFNEGYALARAAAPQPNHYQQLLGVAYVVLGCLAANGVDIPVRFLDAFSDPDSVENPLELLPCDFLPAQAVRAAVEAAALTDEQLADLYHRAKAQCVGNWVEHVQSLLVQGASQ